LITCLFFWHIFRKGDKIVSVWGGVAQDIYVLHLYDYLITERKWYGVNDDPVFAILITGSIQTWSIVLEKKCSTEKWVEARLKSFRDKVKLKKHSVGYIFACNEPPGTKAFQDSHIESNVFERLFPKVPLVGCFGNGQFGKNTIVDEVKEEGEESYSCFLDENIIFR